MYKLSLVQEEYKVLNVMKFVMAIVVVAIHARPEMSLNSSVVRQIFGAIYSLAVPFFFMASGFLLFRKISLPLKEEGEQRIKSYLARICRLYLVWTIIYLPLTIYGFYIDGLSPVKAGVVFLRNILLVGENYMSWPLWYLLALIVSVGIIYGLLKLTVSKNLIVVCGICMALIGVGLDYCRESAFLQPVTDLYFSLFLKTRNGFFVGFLFVALGMWCASCERLPLWLALLLFFAGIVGLLFHIPLSYALVTGAMFIFSISAKLKTIESAYSTRLREISAVVYFIHMFVLSALVLFANYEYGALLCFVVVALSLLLSLVLTKYNSNRLFRFLFA